MFQYSYGTTLVLITTHPGLFSLYLTAATKFDHTLSLWVISWRELDGKRSMTGVVISEQGHKGSRREGKTGLTA